MLLKSKLIPLFFCLFAQTFVLSNLDLTYAVTAKPNVIILLTDDQGYGDLSAHGNPVLKTPEMDKLRAESVRLTDFHVAPMCTPTRGQLLTGMDAMRNGATAVSQGRSMIRRDLKLMPQFFEEAGYATGLFGKWHLGDSYPHRPRFRGFQEVLSFRAWGITSLADYWNNSYFDPMLMHNGVDTKYEGYCTDIFFDEAMSWIDGRLDEEKPFFLYLPTNTPHKPDVVADEYAKPYRGSYDGKPLPPEFYGMIANIDENLGKLESFLSDRGIKENTILIFFTDNGTQSTEAQAIFNAGMRSKKGTEYEGGHRVPMFIRWVDGNLEHGSDISELTQVQDLLPTLADFCDLNLGQTKIDGQSLAGLLTGKVKELPERMCVSQFRTSGERWKHAVVMSDKWRLVSGEELYNVERDPSQENNVISSFPEVANQMRAYYDSWYQKSKAEFDKKRFIIIGNEKANPSTLYASDWLGSFCDNRGGLISGKGRGYWDLLVDQKGEYEIELRRWSEESEKRLTESYNDESSAGARPIAKARLTIGDFSKIVILDSEDTVARFRMNLEQGGAELRADFLDEEDKLLCSAMYVKVNLK